MQFLWRNNMCPQHYGQGTKCDDSTRCMECSEGICFLHGPKRYSNFVLNTLEGLAIYCEEQAYKDENFVIEAYFDQWMAARTEIVRCAETIRKGGE